MNYYKIKVNTADGWLTGGLTGPMEKKGSLEGSTDEQKERSKTFKYHKEQRFARWFIHVSFQTLSQFERKCDGIISI